MARHRDRHSDFARRDARARAEGFRSYRDKRRHGGAAPARVRNGGELAQLPPAAREQRRRVLRAVAETRTDGLTLAQAARRNGTSVDAMRFWTPGVVDPDDVVTESDRLWRPMRAIDAVTQRVVPVDLRGSRAATRLSNYWLAVEHYLFTGDDEPLRAFDGVRIAGVDLETNTDVIDYLAVIGVLSFETIYQDVAA
ncbi:MAG: hypothetical protein ACLPR9_06180 [Acidimicrobiales bacterium]